MAIYPEAYETEVYINVSKRITIAQSDFGNESIIVLTKDQAKWLSEELQTLINEIE